MRASWCTAARAVPGTTGNVWLSARGQVCRLGSFHRTCAIGSFWLGACGRLRLADDWLGAYGSGVARAGWSGAARPGPGWCVRPCLVRPGPVGLTRHGPEWPGPAWRSPVWFGPARPGLVGPTSPAVYDPARLSRPRHAQGRFALSARRWNLYDMMGNIFLRSVLRFPRIWVTLKTGVDFDPLIP